jgi:transporter, SSS family
MTGLDQDMMQKNLTCKTLRDAQKDMCTYGFAFLPVNLLFMSLGILLMMYLSKMNVPLPASPDELILLPVAGGMLGSGVEVLFTIGVVAACFSTADSALTSLTTSFCVDICEQPKNETLRKRIHFAMSVVFILFILVFKVFNSTSLIDAVYILCSYTYGPLLGLFAFSLLTRRSVNDKFVPYIAIASPLLCFAIDTLSMKLWNYKFGYELLMLNGILTFSGLYISNIKRK